MLQDDRFLLVAQRSGGIVVVEYPLPWSSSLPDSTAFTLGVGSADGYDDNVYADVGVVGDADPATMSQRVVLLDSTLHELVYAKLQMPLRFGSVADVIMRVKMGGEPLQVAVWPPPSLRGEALGESPTFKAYVTVRVGSKSSTRLRCANN